MKRAWNFGKLFLFSPSSAADACLRPNAFVDALKIYAVFVLLELLSSCFYPLAFLDPTAPAPAARGASFWLAVTMWEPILFGLNVFFTVLILDWMRAGWLPLKTGLATIWSTVPPLLAAYRTQLSTALGTGGLVLVLAVWISPAVLLAGRIPRDRWRGVSIFMMGLNAIQLACLAVEYAVVVPTRSVAAFYAFSFISMAWILVCASTGLRRMCAMSTARVALGFLFAVFVGSLAPVLASLVGLMSREVLKVLIYA